jgi:hypothetical protein
MSAPDGPRPVALPLVTFLCSERGGWVNGQQIDNDGGVHT